MKTITVYQIFEAGQEWEVSLDQSIESLESICYPVFFQANGENVPADTAEELSEKLAIYFKK